MTRDLLQRLKEERDLCAAEHAPDISNLLGEAIESLEGWQGVILRFMEGMPAVGKSEDAAAALAVLTEQVAQLILAAAERAAKEGLMTIGGMPAPVDAVQKLVDDVRQIHGEALDLRQRAEGST